MQGHAHISVPKLEAVDSPTNSNYTYVRSQCGSTSETHSTRNQGISISEYPDSVWVNDCTLELCGKWPPRYVAVLHCIPNM